MTKESYQQLSDKEKLIYNEFSDFSLKLVARLDVLTQVVQKLLTLAAQDP